MVTTSDDFMLVDSAGTVRECFSTHLKTQRPRLTRLAASRYCRSIMTKAVRNRMSSTAAGIGVQPKGGQSFLSESNSRIPISMVDLQAGPGGRTLRKTAGFFVLQALGDCQHFSKSEYPPSATTTTFAPPPPHPHKPSFGLKPRLTH
jgi:hypothetical protein